jgi:choline dehydrogenase-like flavoprotein
VERFIGVTGQAEGLPQLPDGQFLPPMELRCAERVVRDKLLARWGGERLLTIGRAAILTRNHNGRAACHYCGPCERGCITHSYFSSIGSTLPAARRTGRMTLRPNSVVHSVIYDESRDRATGVRVIDAATMRALEFRARVIFLCASTMESARLLLNSKSARFSTGLGNSSGQLGRNLMDHAYGAGASGTIPGLEDRTSYGRRPNGIYIARFRNVKDKHPDFLRGYGFQGGAGRSGPPRPRTGFGPEFKQALFDNTPGPWSFGISGWAECLPREDNRIELHPTLVDKWGIPALKVDCTWGPNERALLKDMQVTAAEMLEAAGATGVRTHDSRNPPGHCIHEMGTARMGRDPKTSVLNGNNQAWDAPNVFVTDGACMASSANQNPSITYMALTARAAGYAVDAMKRNEL